MHCFCIGMKRKTEVFYFYPYFSFIFGGVFVDGITGIIYLSFTLFAVVVVVGGKKKVVHLYIIFFSGLPRDFGPFFCQISKLHEKKENFGNFSKRHILSDFDQ